MTKAKVGDLVRILPNSWVVKNDKATVGEIVEVIKVYSDYSGIEVHTSKDNNVPVAHYEYALFDAKKEQGTPREEVIKTAADQLGALLVRKNHDYGDSFSQQFAKYGLMSALIRMDDKMRRLETLQSGQQAKVEESISDTLLDLAGYALLAYLETKTRRN